MIAGEKGFLERLLDVVSAHRRTIVVGTTDAGKSTIVRELADALGTLVLDADIGQNEIGPPSTLALGERKGGSYRPIAGYFCGSTSPAGHFLPMIAGSARLMAMAGPRPVLINTTGLAAGEAGRALKTEKINALEPDLILAIERGSELQYLDAFARAGVALVKFKPYPGVTSRSRAERDRLRAASFRAHFESAAIDTHALDSIGIERSLLNNGLEADAGRLSELAGSSVARAEVSGDEALVVFDGPMGSLEQIAEDLGVRMVYAFNAGDFAGALVGLIDADGRLLCLGLIDRIDFRGGTIAVYAKARSFSALQLGSLRLDPVSFASAGAFRPMTYRHKH